MKKLIALIVTLCIVATMSLTSFAAVTVTSGEGDAIKIIATATDEEGVFTFDEATTTFETTTEATSGNGQTTILAVAGYDNSAASITTTSIQYINQGTEKNFTFALKEGLITEENPNAVVTILMGGDGMPSEAPVATVATLTIATVDDGGEEGGEDTETITVAYGDVNGDGEVGAADASLVLQKGVNLIAGFTDQEGRTMPETVGDVNGDSDVGAADASLILQKGVKLIAGFTDQEGNALTTYTYVAPTK